MIPVGCSPRVAPSLHDLHGLMLAQLPHLLETLREIQASMLVDINTKILEEMFRNMCLNVIGKPNLHQALVGCCLNRQIILGGAEGQKVVSGFEGGT